MTEPTYFVALEQDTYYDESPLRWVDDNIMLVLSSDQAREVNDNAAATVIAAGPYAGSVREHANSYFPCLCGRDEGKGYSGTPLDHIMEDEDAEEESGEPIDTSTHEPDCFPAYIWLGGPGASAYLTSWDNANAAIGFTDSDYGGADDRGRAYLEASLSLFKQWANGEVYVVSLVESRKCELGKTHNEYLDSIGGCYLDQNLTMEDSARELAREYFLLPDGSEIPADIEVTS